MGLFSKKEQSPAHPFPELPPLPDEPNAKEYNPSKKLILPLPLKPAAPVVEKPVLSVPLKPAISSVEKKSTPVVEKKVEHLDVPKPVVVPSAAKVSLPAPVILEKPSEEKQKPSQAKAKLFDTALTPENSAFLHTSDAQVFSDKKELMQKVEGIKIAVNKPAGDLLEQYELVVDQAHVETEIIKEEKGVTYNLYIPEISSLTSALLDEVRNELISITSINMQELIDPSLFSLIKKRFMDDARRLLREKLPHNKLEMENFLVGSLMQEMLGLGKIEFLIADPNLEEIVIPSSKEPIRVYSKKYGWLMTNLRIEREEDIVNYSNIIARRVGKQITVLNPLLDAHLVTGDRINAVLYPVNTKGNTITIRKFARDPFTIIDFIKSKTCDLNIAAVVWMAIEYEMNVLISGGTGSGKTSFLNSCMPFVPPNQRIISIEDTRELMLPDFLYWTPLVTRTPNPEGKGEVNMLDLLVNSLRMRPDRIILGEMRRQQEAMVLFEAMHTGHSVYATVHADTAPETISRLVNPPLNVPPNLLKAVNLNVVMFRDRKRGIRRVLQLAEFEAEKTGARANVIYRWTSERDEIVKHSESSRFFEDISRNTGMSQTDIEKELTEKKNILSWLIKHNIRSLEDFGCVMNLFYRNRELLLDAMKKDRPELILKKSEEQVSRDAQSYKKRSEDNKPLIQKKEVQKDAQSPLKQKEQKGMLK